MARTLQSIDQFDDFTFDIEGNIFAVTGAGNSIEIVSANGHREKIFVGNLNSTTIAEPTAAAFGRRKRDRHILYVTTTGGLVTPVDGNITIGGQLVAITTPFKG